MRDGDLPYLGGQAPAVKQHTVRRPQGQITISEPDVALQEYDTQNCCHCSKVFKVVPGSGTKRGFCFLCSAVTCGSTACDGCVPMERQLELMEGGDPSTSQF